MKISTYTTTDLNHTISKVMIMYQTINNITIVPYTDEEDSSLSYKVIVCHL